MRLYPRRLAVTLAVTAGITTALLAPPSAAQAADGVVVKSDSEHGLDITINGGHVEATALWGVQLTPMGFTIRAYSVDKDADVVDGASMVSAEWSAFPSDPAANSGKAAWVLHNSYPTRPVAELSANLNTPITAPEAISGTQAALWHFADGTTLDAGNDPEVTAVYNYLLANAAAPEAVTPDIKITPSSLKGKAGKKLGPFAVKTNAEFADVRLYNAPEGSELVDEAGQPLGDRVTNGTKVYFKAPAGTSGNATIEISSQWNTLTGRLYVGENVATQTLAIPHDIYVEKSSAATVQWTP